ncbi:Cof-type HAD-IIB family hydrolase [Lapidilactobacillus bayanensis]|uniref:Cof-type HAD-IIB family hydrolase n=1 Tax=Lapidilactobacillus bayanensis TaxID=2485998 RepID=UPI000F789D92|nr:Cof-type HAD-IIB family hydrolase [Lapidilactobacillus bayanensis]
MTIKLIALDIDDTLLTSKGEILPSTATAIRTALERGIKVVLCSGRPLAGIKPYLDQLGIAGSEQYVIANGGGMIETVTGDTVTTHLINNADYRQMTAFAQERQVPFNVVSRNSEIITADRNIYWLIAVQAWENKAGILVRDPVELPGDFQIAKGVFVNDEASLDAIEADVRAEFSDHLYVVRAGREFLEIMNPNAGKGRALADLSRILNIVPAEVMAVGDEGNDIAMFHFAGTAVAMGNGTAEAKRHADFVTGANDDGGLAAAIKKYALS